MHVGKKVTFNQPDKRNPLPLFAGYYLLIIQSETQSLVITHRITEGVVCTGCEHQHIDQNNVASVTATTIKILVVDSPNLSA